MSKKGDGAPEKATGTKKSSTPSIRASRSKPGERPGNLRRREEWFQRRSGASKP